MPFAVLGAVIAGAVGAAGVGAAAAFGATSFIFGIESAWIAAGVSFAVAFAGPATGGNAQARLPR